jgi:RimJ/RimL family protein N-acetyltransferase
MSRPHRRGDIGVLIGERDEQGKGYAAQAIAGTCDYGFAELGLAKITASFHADNVGSIKSFEKAGFTEEGQRRAQYFRDGAWRDEVLLARFVTRR